MTINFNTANITALALAKVGNPQRGETLKTSKELCQFNDQDKDMLTLAFTKPFKNLNRSNFYHSSNIELNEMFSFATTIFDQKERFLSYSRKIARHLFDQTKHPNIKAGDLCIALIDGIKVDGKPLSAISIVKSESLFPFLEISDKDGDLHLTTHNGIYPEKIDKGCLILDSDREGGTILYTFDKSGADTNFWVRDFLGARAKKDNDFKTRQYAEMCVSFAEDGLPGDVPTEQRYRVANDALAYMNEREQFDARHFQEEVLKDPTLVANFQTYKNQFTDEDGEALDDNFTISKHQLKKAGSKIKGELRLDTGVIIRFTPEFNEREPDILQRGYDDKMKMKYVKIYYNEEC
jgi:hypothetical protein